MERPFDHAGMSEPDGFDVYQFRTTTTDLLQHTSGALGEYVTTVRIWFAPDWWTREEIEAAVDWHIEPEHCYHAHDCCGRYYGGRGKIIDVIEHSRDDNDDPCTIVIVRRDYVRNI